MELGFSLNESVNQTNNSPETIISKHLIKDVILANKMTVNAIKVCPTFGRSEEKESFE